jgi:hypothetical protein
MSNEYEMNRLATLARQLGAATSQRIVRWEQKDSDLYSWGATEGLVTVASRDRDGEPPYQLTVYTAAGAKVDELMSELLADDQPAPWNEPLAELYRVARRSALGADDIIDALLERLHEAAADDGSGSARSFLRRARVGTATEES